VKAGLGESGNVEIVPDKYRTENNSMKLTHSCGLNHSTAIVLLALFPKKN
jgi:hypothetical protein